jgi:hypothetical protein
MATCTSNFSNMTDQIYFWGNDTANATTATTAGGFTDTGTTTSGTATDSIIWTNAYIGGGLGSIQLESTAFGRNIRVEPEAQLNISYARPGQFTVNTFQTQARIQGPDEAPVPQRIVTNTVRATPAKPTEPTPQIIANARGQDLLKEIVGDVMYRRFQKEGWIDVPSLEKPGITYRIKPWHEIALLEKNAKKEWVSNNQSICIHARQRHVEGDEVAAHVLLCRYNEKTLWKMGNLHGVRRAA